jgi:hypothetical protein
MKLLDIEYSKKNFKKENLNYIIINYNNKKFPFYIKKNKLNELCIFGDLVYLD